VKQLKTLLATKILVSALLAVIASMNVEGVAMSEDARAALYFVTPFSIETYMPITMDNIEDNSHKVWIATDHRFVTEILQTFQLKPSRKVVDEKEIRFKADFGKLGGLLFFDKRGIVLRKTDGQHCELSGKQLEHIEHLLQEMVGVVDVRAYDRFQ